MVNCENIQNNDTINGKIPKIKGAKKLKKKSISNSTLEIPIVELTTQDVAKEVKVKKKRKHCNEVEILDSELAIPTSETILENESNEVIKCKKSKLEKKLQKQNGIGVSQLDPITPVVKDKNKSKETKTKKAFKKDKKEKDVSSKKSESNAITSTTDESISSKVSDKSSENKREEQVVKVDDKESIATDEFKNYRISASIIEKLQGLGITALFPVQFRTFDSIYDGSDVIIQARTGSGKTLAFAIPIVQKFESLDCNYQKSRSPKVLVLTPTRELAQQVAKTFSDISSKLSVLCVYGGVSIDNQVRKVKLGIDILVGTPGRIIDLLQRKVLDLTQLTHVVLDEVDRMLDMGFLDDVDHILIQRYNMEDRKLNPQTLLFSATLPDWIGQTAKKYLSSEKTVLISFISGTDNKTSRSVEHMAIKCQRDDRASAIGSLLPVYSGSTGRTIIFTDKKKEADTLALSPHLQNCAQVIHGDVPQEKREYVLKAFREGKFRCLIATDVAARGLDIPEVDLVIQCSMPDNIDSYVHRSGRTGRAGRAGVSIILFQHWQEQSISWLQNKLNISIKIAYLPTINEILKASADDLKKTIKEVPLETIEVFREQATALVKELGGVESLAAAIAIITGHKNMKNKSLLAMKEDYNTYHLEVDKQFNYISYVWKALEKMLPLDMYQSILFMKTCSGQKGCVFDLPCKFDSDISKLLNGQASFKIQKITVLPELLMPKPYEQRNNSFNTRNNNYNNYRNNR